LERFWTTRSVGPAGARPRTGRATARFLLAISATCGGGARPCAYPRVPLQAPVHSRFVHILLIEDDTEAARVLVKGLRESGYTVDHAADGRDGLSRALAGKLDLIVTDRMLPHIDGLAIIQQLRRARLATPVLVLSALGTVDDRIRGLKAGGDDYLTKPFAFAELLARIEALLRRRPGAAAESTVLRVADLEFDLLARKVTRGGREIELTSREQKLLEFLMRREGQVITRTMLLEGVWDLH